ncbi:MAG: SocA family protein [Prevotella sp.]|nr:SocA family protein [Prevotella sp.]
MAKDIRKIVQALVYLANYQPDKMLDNMKAYKLLWLADRYHLRQTGRTITGDAYYAMPFGIVPSDAKCLLENAKTKLKEPKGYKNKYLILDDHQYKAIAEPDLKEFSESDLEALDKVLAVYNQYDAMKLSEISHKFPEWTFYKEMLENKDAKNSYKIDFDHFFEDAPEDERRLFDDSHELLELTQDLYHQYNRV